MRAGGASRRPSAALIGAAAWAANGQAARPAAAAPDAPSASGSVCKVCGEIRSIREVLSGRPKPAQAGVRTESIGSQPGSDDWRVVGTVAYPALGGAKTDEGWRVGAVGTPEMQSQLEESSYDITWRWTAANAARSSAATVHASRSRRARDAAVRAELEPNVSVAARASRDSQERAWSTTVGGSPARCRMLSAISCWRSGDRYRRRRARDAQLRPTRSSGEEPHETDHVDLHRHGGPA